MKLRKTIALVAHDNRKKDMAEWVSWNSEIIKNIKWFALGLQER